MVQGQGLMITSTIYYM